MVSPWQTPPYATYTFPATFWLPVLQHRSLGTDGIREASSGQSISVTSAGSSSTNTNQDHHKNSIASATVPASRAYISSYTPNGKQIRIALVGSIKLFAPPLKRILTNFAQKRRVVLLPPQNVSVCLRWRWGHASKRTCGRPPSLLCAQAHWAEPHHTPRVALI
jgi:hypothetical protein